MIINSFASPGIVMLYLLIIHNIFLYRYDTAKFIKSFEKKDIKRFRILHELQPKIFEITFRKQIKVYFHTKKCLTFYGHIIHRLCIKCRFNFCRNLCSSARFFLSQKNFSKFVKHRNENFKDASSLCRRFSIYIHVFFVFYITCRFPKFNYIIYRIDGMFTWYDVYETVNKTIEIFYRHPTT